jgi:hypothetical protein
MLLKFNNFISENFENKGTLLYYAFDWDDNILKMPTEIIVQTNDGDEVGMTTADFAVYRSKIGKEDFEYKGKNIISFAEEPFRNFRDTMDPDIFKKDVTKALEMKSYAPAWNDFIECLTNGSVFAIITARGHEVEGMRKGVEYVIDTLSQEDKSKMHDSLLMFLHLFDKSRDNEDSYESLSNFSKSELVQDYLDLCHFVGVSAPSRGGSPDNPEAAKEDALRIFISDINGYAQKIGSTAKVGFSDDDPGNVKHITHVLSSTDLDHEKLWPFVDEFIIKDTNKPENILKTNIPTKIKQYDEFSENMSQTPGLESSIMPFTSFNNLAIEDGKANDRFSTGGGETRQDPYTNLLKNKVKRLAKESNTYCDCCDSIVSECKCGDGYKCSCSNK